MYVIISYRPKMQSPHQGQLIYKNGYMHKATSNNEFALPCTPKVSDLAMNSSKTTTSNIINARNPQQTNQTFLCRQWRFYANILVAWKSDQRLRSLMQTIGTVVLLEHHLIQCKRLWRLFKLGLAFVKSSKIIFDNHGNCWDCAVIRDKLNAKKIIV